MNHDKNTYKYIYPLLACEVKGKYTCALVRCRQNKMPTNKAAFYFEGCKRFPGFVVALYHPHYIWYLGTGGTVLLKIR